MHDIIATTLTEEYGSHLKVLERLLRKHGYKVKAYNDPSLPHYSRWSEKQKAEILQALRAYVEALNDITQPEAKPGAKPEPSMGDHVDMRQFVWRFLLRMGIIPSEDLFSLLPGEQYIQIYNVAQFQIFRSLRCFERCSFTLEELTSKSWFELWDRHRIFYFALTGLVTKIISFMKPTLLPLDFPYHTVREMNSECLFEFRYKIKSVSVLTRQKQVQAAVLIEDWKY